MTPKEAVNFVKENDAQFVDIRFTDLMGTWQHFTIPAYHFDEDKFEDGLAFDGSSIRGFQTINESDMILIPDADSLFIDPFTDATTAMLLIGESLLLCALGALLGAGLGVAPDAPKPAEPAEPQVQWTPPADTAAMPPACTPMPPAMSHFRPHRSERAPVTSCDAPQTAG
jgi:hypothetical protein